jgi:hypothetical protein
MTDSDDALTRFRSLVNPKKTSAPEADMPPASASPTAARHAEGRRYDAYEPFENEVRTTTVEIRCHSSGLSYFMQYAHMSAFLFNFREENGIFFTGDGYAVTIVGRNLRPVMMALRLHTCGTIQDFNPAHHIEPLPVDPNGPFIESITVEVLRPQKPGDAAPSGAKRTEKA